MENQVIQNSRVCWRCVFSLDFPNIMTRVIYQGTDFLSCYDWFPLGNGPSDAWKFTEFCVHVWSLFRRRLAFSADGGATPKICAATHQLHCYLNKWACHWGSVAFCVLNCVPKDFVCGLSVGAEKKKAGLRLFSHSQQIIIIFGPIFLENIGLF